MPSTVPGGQLIPGQSPPSAGRLVLVDDSEIVRIVLAERLATMGWQVQTAAEGREALRVVSEWRPDVVVCDLHMPEMNGYEVMRQLRRIDPTLPVIVHSSDDDLTAVLQAVHDGAFDYVLKADEDARPLVAAVDRAASHARLIRENARLTSALRTANEELSQRLVELQGERNRSERLLLNILPRPIAERLKNGSRTIADRFADVTVMFADIVDFTSMSADKAPHAVVGILNDVFSAFDALADRHQLEKIKTIGDAYMAAAGLPAHREDHAEAVAELALDMLDAIASYNRKSGCHLRLRIGINTGPVVAGVIGTKKFIYDLWGDTVNIASRLEAQGIPGRIQVSQETYERLRRAYRFEARGTVDVRGRGEMFVHVLTGRRE